MSDAYRNILGQAQQVAQTPYQAYTGQLTAGLTQPQTTAINTLTSAQGNYQPYFDQASTYGQQGTTAVTPTAFSSEALQQYQNPYTQSVVDATIGDLQRIFGSQQNQVVGNAISSGAWGGSRAGLAQASLAGNQANTAATTLAQLRSDAYNNAVSQFNTANNAQMTAQQQNNSNALNAAGLFGTLGTGATQNATTLGNALMNAGNTAQQTDQAGLDALYQQWQNQQQYPFSTLSWLSGIASGIGSSAGGTSTATGTQSGGSADTLGTILAGAGLLGKLPIFSDERLKENVAPVGELYDGQPIYRYNYRGDETPRIGLIAQDVEQVHPEAVGGLGGFKTVDYDAATAPAAGLGAAMASGGYVPEHPMTRGAGLPQARPMEQPHSGLGLSQIMADKTVQSGLGNLASGLGDVSRQMQGGIGLYAAGGEVEDTPPFGGGLPRGFRNNNPGNIKDSPFTRGLAGYAGTEGPYAVFDSPQAGLSAMNSLLGSYQKRGLNTVSDIVGRWAPAAADNNDTSGYVKYVANRLGVDPNAPLTDEARSGLAPAMAYFENGREFPASGENPINVRGGSLAQAQGANSPMAYASDAPAPQAGLGAPSEAAPERRGLFDADVSDALIAAGLGMLSSRNIGTGGLYGLQTYAGAQQAKKDAATKAQDLALKLQESRRKASMDERELKLKEEAAGRGSFTVVGPVTDAEGNATGTAVINNRTGEIETRPVVVTKRPGEQPKFGLNPVYGVDDKGNPVVMQLGSNGQITRSQMPQGVTVSKEPIKVDAGTHIILLDPITRQPVGQIPKNVAGAAAAKAVGTAAGEAQAQMPGAESMTTQIRQQVDALANDPYLPKMVGPLASRMPNITAEAARVQARMDQLKGGVFLQGYQMLKGGGAITEVEGLKAENAMARLSTAQNIEDYQQALGEFRDALTTGLAKLRAQGAMVPGADQNFGTPGGVASQPIPVNGAQAPDPLAAAREAIAKGAPRDTVIQRLRDRGIDPAGI